MAKLYTNIDYMPFLRFEKMIIDKDVTQLIIKGKPTAEELAAAELAIFSQYCERAGDDKPISISKAKAEIEMFTARIKRITELVNRIATSNMGILLVPALKAEGYTLVFSEETLHKDLQRVMVLLKQDLIKRDRLLSLLEKLCDEGDNSKQGKVTTAFFTQALIECSKIEGYRVNKAEITVGEYCIYIRRLKDKIEKQTTSWQN